MRPAHSFERVMIDTVTGWPGDHRRRMRWLDDAAAEPVIERFS
jgi:hypothetical protein